MSNVPPKSAIELAMEKLAKQDVEAGTEARILKPEQKQAIAVARQDYEARTAECRILYDSTAATVFEPEARTELAANYRRDLARLTSDRDRKLEKILKGTE
jgi:predicted P-loop ATPase